MAAKAQAEILSEHAYSGGYNLNEVYGGKKPSKTSSITSHPEDYEESVPSYDGVTANYGTPLNDLSRPGAAHAGDEVDVGVPTGGYDLESVYGSGSPNVTEEPQNPGYVAKPSYGKDDNESGNRLGYGQKPHYGGDDNETESRPVYGWKPTYGQEDDPTESGPAYGRKPSQGWDESGSEFRPAHGRTPNYGETDNGSVARPKYGRKPTCGELDDESEFQSAYGEFENESEHRPAYGGKPTAGQDDNVSERPAYDKMPSFGKHDADRPGQGWVPAYGVDAEDLQARPTYGRKPVHLVDDESELQPGNGRRKNTGDEGPEYGFRVEHNGHEGSTPGYQRHASYEESEYGGYGGRKSDGLQDEDYCEYKGSRPPFAGQDESGAFESGYKKYEYRHEEDERRGRPSHYRVGHDQLTEHESLASETGSLSLGTGSRRGGGHRKKHDDSDEEREHHNKHGHHQERDDY